MKRKTVWTSARSWVIPGSDRLSETYGNPRLLSPVVGFQYVVLHSHSGQPYPHRQGNPEQGTPPIRTALYISFAITV